MSRLNGVLEAGIELLAELLGSGEATGRFQSTAQGRLSGGFQAHAGGAAASLNAGAGVEDNGLDFEEHLLFDGREF